MIDYDKENKKLLSSIQKRLDNVLENNSDSNNEKILWSIKYNNWNSLPENHFQNLLRIDNPFNIIVNGDAIIFDGETIYFDIDNNGRMAIENIKKAIFIANEFYLKEHFVIEASYKKSNPDDKLKIIKDYFEFIDNKIRDIDVMCAYKILADASEQQYVLDGPFRQLDIYKYFYMLHEIIYKYSIETVYLLYTLWRITKDKKDLKRFLESAGAYITTNFESFSEIYKEMHFDIKIENLIIEKKINIICFWLYHIADIVDDLMDQYSKMNWITPRDRILDLEIITTQISRFEMFQKNFIYYNLDEKTVTKRAFAEHGYSLWVKSVDLFHMCKDVLRILNQNNNCLETYRLNPSEILDYFEKISHITEYYKNLLFEHNTFYDNKREKFNAIKLEAEEKNATIIRDSIDDILQVTSFILDDNIDGLMYAKQKFIQRISRFISNDQIILLDKYTDEIAKKIKNSIQNEEDYDEIYYQIRSDFNQYNKDILQHYNGILDSLASAEFLYEKYLKEKNANSNFDYSCISIMYYMSLEDFLNKIVYTPYAENILAPNKRDALGPNNKKYAKNISYFRNGKTIRRTCELGPIGHLLKDIKEEQYFLEYIEKNFPNSNLNLINEFGDKIIKISPKRNNAAHGGNIITYDEAFSDKLNVYEKDDIEQFRGLIKELLKLFLH